MNYKPLAVFFALAAISAHALEGQVVDNAGDPVAGVTIEINKSKEVILTDDKGRFEVADDTDELHFKATGYSHRTVHLHDLNDKKLEITLFPTVIEQVDVTGLPIHASVIESSLPVTVLSGEALRQQQAATLGDSLEKQPGVNTSFHGKVASTPVIRGLSGPRVLITQNSLDVSDVSRVGPDHAVASEVSTAQQVEVLRGPATLFYGSGAIGGVVNVVDQRVPKDTEQQGEFSASHDTVNSQNLLSFNTKNGTENWGFYADAFWRDADNYEVPFLPEEDEHGEDHEEDEHEAEHEEHSEDDIVVNSDEESTGVTLGGSYIFDSGYVGIAVERLEREYGIPGHSHGHHDEHGDEEEEGEGEGEHLEERIYGDLEQNRYQLRSEIILDSGWLRAINTGLAYTDYTHSEIEDGEAATTFSNETAELRVDLFHQELDHWKGVLNFHYKHGDVATGGREAFTPSSTTETVALALVEEKHVGNVLLQFGARVERVSIDADTVSLPHVELHAHDEEEGTGEPEDEHDEEDTLVFSFEDDFTPVSVSVGAVWDFSDGYNVGIALSHAQRAPSAPELLSFGAHIGAGIYEVGAIFDLHEEDDELHFEVSDRDLELETSNNIDLSFRKHSGNVGIILNAFFNKIDDYYYQYNTGLYAASGHDHEEEPGGEENEHEEGHDDELPVYLFQYENAELYGFEGQLIWRFNNAWTSTFFSDFVHAELTDGRYLPRTPPLRFGADLDYTGERFGAGLSWTHYAEQDKVAPLESTTEAYDILDASASYKLPVGSMDLVLFAKAENLTDEEALVHTSFIKEEAPLPGLNFSLGIRGSF